MRQLLRRLTCLFAGHDRDLIQPYCWRCGGRLKGKWKSGGL